MIGGLFLAAVFLLTGQKASFLQNRRQLWYLTVSGVTLGASWMFLYEAYQQVGVSIASLAYYCGPVIVMALSPILFHEKLSWVKSAGFLTVLLGIFFVNTQALHEGKNGWGLFCGAMSAVMYAVMVIANKKVGGVTGLENAMLQLVFGFLTVAVFLGAKQGLTLHMAGGDWLPVLTLGLLNTGIGCYLYFSSIGDLPVQSVAICGYLEPLSAVVFSAVFLREALRPIQIVGVALILGGAAFGECAFSRRN